MVPKAKAFGTIYLERCTSRSQGVIQSITGGLKAATLDLEPQALTVAPCLLRQLVR